MLKAAKWQIDRLRRLVRDELLNKYLLTHMLSPTRQEDAWVSAAREVLGEAKFSGGVSDLLRKLSIGITRGATGLSSDIDLSAAAFPLTIDALSRIADVAGETVYVLDGNGSWIDRTTKGYKTVIQKPGRSGYIELAIVDRRDRLKGRISVNLWRQVADVLECTAPQAPIKKILAGCESRLTPRRVDTVIEPIDVVYTWVNADDPAWRDLIAPYRDVTTVDHDRFAQVDELKYSIRSLFTFAPWVRKVYIFTNCAPPEWFQPSDRIQWVKHEEVIPEAYLPLFNSHAIETFLHEIPGLSERYIYFNDDVFLSGAVRPTDFFNAYGQSVSRMETSGVLTHLEQRVEAGTAEEWQYAAVNSAKLLFKETGVFPLRLHRHAPHVYQRSVYSELAKKFPKELEVTRTSRFRQKTDYTFTSFLFHHFALWQGKAAHLDEESMVVHSSNYKRFLARKIYSTQRFFCINDGGGSANDADFRKFKEKFLNAHYPFKSPAEI